MKLRYFALFRQRLGVAEEEVSLPPEVRSVADLIAWQAGRGEAHAALFGGGQKVMVALDQRYAKPDEPLAGVAEIALFPPVTGG